MSMPMGVRLSGRSIRPVLMLVMLIVTMPMFVSERLMDMLMVVPLGQMQP